MYLKRITKNTLLVAFSFAAFAGCKKLDRPKLGDYPRDDQALPAGNLRFYVPFDLPGEQFRQKAADSISGNPAFFSSKNPTLVAGVKGNSMKGADNTAALYLNANDMSTAASFSVAFWEKNTVPGGGQPQFVFSLPDKDFWHNSGMFLLVDHAAAGSNTSEAVVKFAVEDHWFEFTGGSKKMPGNILDNNWHHLVFAYDAGTSKMSYYVDGQQLTGLPASLTDFMDGSTPHGPIKLKKESVSRFVLGGWNKHGGVAGPTDDWIQSWQGGLDQFRMYNKALTASEVQALYNSRM